ncbi:MAG: hypothetical protein R3F61_37960 [Myxococcota bacterium]
MPTWLHDLDTLRSLAEESGPIADWARLQRLGRHVDTALPTGLHFLAPMLALLPDGLDAWVTGGGLGADTLWMLEVATELGAAPAVPGAWTPTLEAFLGGPNGRHAANTLVRLGAFTRAHLRMVLAADRDDDVLVAWVLASTPVGELDATARAIAEGLRDDLEQGAPRVLRALELITPGHPSEFQEDPEHTVEMGAELAGREYTAPVVKGSVRTRSATLATQLSQGRTTPTTALVQALAALQRAPAVHPAALCALSWEAHYTPSGDPLIDVMERSSRAPADIRAARMAVRAGAEPPAAVADIAHRAVQLEHLARNPALAGELLQLPWLDTTDSFLRAAIALVHPDCVPPLLDQAETRPLGIPLASFAPTEEVLTRLLSLPVPADPDLRYDLGGALVSSGDPAALPHLRALLGHLEPAQVSELKGLALSIFNQEL